MDEIQRKIDETVGLATERLDLTTFTDVEDVIPFVASSAPGATIADLSEYASNSIQNLQQEIQRAADALETLHEFKSKVDSRSPNKLVLTEFLSEVEDSFLFDSDECSSSKGWLIEVAIQAYKSGDVAALQRLIEASPHLDEVYKSGSAYDAEWKHNMLSDTFDAYVSRASEFVKGKLTEFGSYRDFITRLERAEQVSGNSATSA